MKKQILKVRNFRKVQEETTVDTFTNRTIDDVQLKLNIKDTGNCIIENPFQVIGWTDDVHFAFDVLNNSVPISTYEEIFNNRC